MKVSSFLRKKRGFTLIETLTTLMVMSILVRIGIPNYQEVALKAEAARVAGDFNVVRQAVSAYQADNNRWPADFGPGQVPPGLAPYLPDGFSFKRGRYWLDWENWSLPSGLPSSPGTRAILGVSVVTEDRALGLVLGEFIGPSSAHFALAGSYTFILEAQ